MNNMKYWILAAFTIILAACSNDTERKLDGKWQLQQMEANGEVIKADTVYYNFQNLLFMYQVYLPATETFVIQYGNNSVEDDDKLILQLADDPGPISNFLRYTDWQSGTRTFTIEKLSGKQLILNSEGKRYIFRKF